MFNNMFTIPIYEHLKIRILASMSTSYRRKKFVVDLHELEVIKCYRGQESQ